MEAQRQGMEMPEYIDRDETQSPSMHTNENEVTDFAGRLCRQPCDAVDGDQQEGHRDGGCRGLAGQRIHHQLVEDGHRDVDQLGL